MFKKFINKHWDSFGRSWTYSQRFPYPGFFKQKNKLKALIQDLDYWYQLKVHKSNTSPFYTSSTIKNKLRIK